MTKKASPDSQIVIVCIAFFMGLIPVSLQGQTKEMLLPWKQVTSDAGFPIRDSAGEVVFKNRMWIMGGWYDSKTANELRDVWSSVDGVTWRLETDRAPWKHPQHPVSLVFDDKMWMLGGYQGGRLPGADQTSEVWWSADGVAWTRAGKAPWEPRFASTGAVFNGKMWILGGSQFPGGASTDSAIAFNDVWCSSDGVNWTKVSEHAPWSARGYSRALVHDGKLWLLGGGNYRTPASKLVVNNDVWCSSDGVNWTCVTEHAPWSPRIWHEAIVYNGEMWILGGGSSDKKRLLNDIWHSSDGVSWTLETDQSIWSPRHEMSVYDFEGKLWVVGGAVATKAGLANDVWQTEIATAASDSTSVSENIPSIEREKSIAAKQNIWRQRGFDDFRNGTFGNGGQNLYVSRSGILQRIFQFDLNRDGFLDLVFCNSHGKDESPPVFVYSDPLRKPAKRIELVSDGAVSGTVADLNGDGLDDLILAMADNGVRKDLNSYIYFGSSDGFSEKQLLLLPTPGCTSTAAGDFNGDGKLDVTFLLGNKVRVFYQNHLGFEPRRFKDLAISGLDIAAERLINKETADLVVRTASGDIDVYWGKLKFGLTEDDSTKLKALGTAPNLPATEGIAAYPELHDEALPVIKVLRIGNMPHLLAADKSQVNFVPVRPDKTFGRPICLSCPKALSAAVGDLDGDGFQDIVVASRDKPKKSSDSTAEQSWIYWGSKSGTYSESRRTPLESHRACDVVASDLDGDGCPEVVLCQYYTDESYSSTSYIYRCSRDRHFAAPVKLATDDARRVLLIPSGNSAPQLAFINRMGGDRLGNPDASIYWGDGKDFDAKRQFGLAAWGAVESITPDLNDDGLPDVVLANGAEDTISKDPGGYVFFNSPQGLKHEPSLRLPTARCCGVCCGDLNHDGFLDLVCCGFTNSDLLVFHGNDRGRWDTRQKLRLEYDGVVYEEPRWIYLADLNSDGWLDLVVPMILSDRSLIYWGGSEGFSNKRCTALAVEQAGCARAADLLGRGQLDLVFGGYKPTAGIPHNSFAYLFWNGPDGIRQDRCTQLPAAGANSMAVADFNNDGTLDLFVGSYYAVVDRDTDSFIYWNRTGSSGFSARDRSRLFTHSASGALAADFNEDGWTDLAIAYHKIEGSHCGQSAVWWNGPDGFDPNRVLKLPTIGPHGMTCIAPANQLDGGLEEFYQSVAFRLPERSQIKAIDWQADTPPRTWVKMQIRVAENRESLASALWTGPNGAGTWFTKSGSIPATISGNWVQYRLALGAKNGVASPRIREVSISYAEATLNDN